MWATGISLGLTLGLLGAAAVDDPWIGWLSRTGVVGVLAFVVVAFLRGWLVPGRVHDRVVAERDRAFAQLERNLTLAEKAVDLTAERLRVLQELERLRKDEA